jgi:dTDP-4-dehydrorhamnose reductase
MRVVVLGASGMLGAMVLDWLSRDADLDLVATARSADRIPRLREKIGRAEYRVLDAERGDPVEIDRVIAGAAWVVNAIGVIKPYIHDDNAAEVECACRVNSLFPHLLAHAAERHGAWVIQIATDCVYSGRTGHYDEAALHDAVDVYGKTKSLGEVYSTAVYHLRCSIIGPEPKGHVSLLDWFRRQPAQAQLNGFTNHLWNGITTFHFARICHGIIRHPGTPEHVQHIIPTGQISKAEMLACFAKAYRREDIAIAFVQAKTVIDRTLATRDEARNRQLWSSAGYVEPPTVPAMIAELAEYDFGLDGIRT